MDKVALISVLSSDLPIGTGEVVITDETESDISLSRGEFFLKKFKMSRFDKITDSQFDSLF